MGVRGQGDIGDIIGWTTAKRPGDAETTKLGRRRVGDRDEWPGT